jgi:hypothetical protein
VLTELQEAALDLAARDPLGQQELIVAVTTAGPALTQASEIISRMRRIGIASQLLLIALDPELVSPGGFCDMQNVTCVFRETPAYEWASRRRRNEGWWALFRALGRLPRRRSCGVTNLVCG